MGGVGCTRQETSLALAAVMRQLKDKVIKSGTLFKAKKGVAQQAAQHFSKSACQCHVSVIVSVSCQCHVSVIVCVCVMSVS